MGQLLTGQSSPVASKSVAGGAARLVAAVLWAALAAGCGPAEHAPAAPASAAPAPGGELVASVHTDPRTFNQLVVTGARDSTTNLVTTLTHATLVRLEPRHGQDVEPWLAESWTRAADGLGYTIEAAAERHLLRRPYLHVR